MYDEVFLFSERAVRESRILKELNFKGKDYLLVTIHRPYNVDDLHNFRNIRSAFIEIGENIIFLSIQGLKVLLHV